jgi:hypothetical protein
MTLRSSLRVAATGLMVLTVAFAGPLLAQDPKPRPNALAVVLGGRTFEVPRNYLVGSWMLEEQAPIKLVAPSSLDFSFWASDRKPPLRKPAGWFINEYWPREDGRQRFGPSDFLVTIHARQRKPGLGEKWVHPAQMAEMVLSNAPWLGDQTRSKRFGLDCYQFKPVAYPSDDALFRMCTGSGNEPELYLVNRRPEDRDVVIVLGPDSEEYLKRHGTYWRLDAWYESDGLFFNAFFPEEALERWRDVVQGATSLLRAWRTK